jgi:DNA-binding XRE family transcriptional regulator
VVDRKRRSGPRIKADISPQAIAKRLRLAREATGLGQRAFAKGAGLASNTYNQWETGAQPPRLDYAVVLCETYHWTLDYIYRGDPANMPGRVWAHIQKHST